MNGSTRPSQPRHRQQGVGGRIFAVISSPRLAIALLVAVLACCLVGVTVYPGEAGWRLIFSTYWFNALLAALAVSSGVTFLARVRGRRLTLVSVGMIVFHVSFLTLLLGVVYNSLFHFHGMLRLTEGETLPNGQLESYDVAEAGRLFSFSRLRGETTLLRMHVGYRVDGQEKRAAYEISVGEGERRVTKAIYVTENLEVDGVRYLVAKEGYSVGVELVGRDGRVAYAGMVPLQSHVQPDGRYRYTTGTAVEAKGFAFPPEPEQPVYWLSVGYVPKEGAERAGEVTLEAAPVAEGAEGASRWRWKGKVPVGGGIDAGEHRLVAGEVRFWVGMDVRHDPGLLAILTSLWGGLGGMTMTFAGRLLQDARRKDR